MRRIINKIITPRDEPASLFRDAKWFGGSLYFTKAVTIPCSVITARLLGPLMMGTWNSFNLILYYSSFLQLGVFDGMTREIPYAKGIGETNKVRDYREMVFTFSLITGLFGIVAILFGSTFLREKFDPVVIFGIKVMAIVVFFYHLYGFYDYYMKAEQNFVIISRAKMLYTLSTSIFQVVGAVIYGIYGLLVGVLLANIMIVTILFLWQPISVKWPTYSSIGVLMRSGVPMLLNGMAASIVATLDRLIILTFLGRRELGYYAVAHLAANLLDFIPATLYQVFLPRIMKRAGQKKDPATLTKFWLEPILVMSIILPLLAGFVWLLARLGLMILLPQYMPGLLALKILVFGVFFGAIPILARNFFVAMNKQYRVLVAYALTIGMSAGLNYIFIRLGMNVAGVALANCISFFVLSLITLFMALKILGQVKDLAVITFKIYSTSFAVIAVLIAIELLFKPSIGIREELFSTALKTGLFIIFIFTLLYIIEKRSKILSWVFYRAKGIQIR
ncbi:MAG: oligosaccharide flippase family protein [Candidatus Jordarchaeaceae archaeon]